MKNIRSRLWTVPVALVLSLTLVGAAHAASVVAWVNGPSSVTRGTYVDYYTSVDYSTDFWGYTGYFYTWYPHALFDQPWKIGGNVDGNGFYLGTNQIFGGDAWEYSASFGLPYGSSRIDLSSRAYARTTGGGWYTGGTGKGHDYDDNDSIWVSVQ